MFLDRIFSRRRILVTLGLFLLVTLLAAACTRDRQVSIDALEERVIQVFDSASPSVVHVTTIVLNADDQMLPGPPQVGTGSGFIVDDQVHIITNNHVVKGASKVEVTLFTGVTVPAEIVGTDPSTDLAVLRIEAEVSESMIAELGDSSIIRVGGIAVAIGSPFGFQQTLTFGVISALDRNLQARDGYGTEIQGVIQTDAAINPGNSGGPLFDTQGKVVGVTTAIFTQGGGFDGIGFAIPIDTVKEVMPQLIDHGFVMRPSLGAAGLALDPVKSQFLGLSVGEGLLIQKVRPGSTGEAAGLQVGSRSVQTPIGPVLVGGDIIVELDDTLIDSIATLNELVRQQNIGDEVELLIVRDGELLTLTVEIGQLSTSESPSTTVLEN